MKKLLNISLLLRIISMCVFALIIIFQNPLIKWVGNNFTCLKFLIPTELIVMQIISIIFYVFLFILLRKGFNETKSIKYEVIAILIIVIGSILFTYLNNVARNFYHDSLITGAVGDNGGQVKFYYMQNLFYFKDMILRIIYISLFVLSAGISIGRKKGENSPKNNLRDL